MNPIQAIETRIATLQALLTECRTAQHYRQVRARLDQASEDFWTLCLPVRQATAPRP